MICNIANMYSDMDTSLTLTACMPLMMMTVTRMTRVSNIDGMDAIVNTNQSSCALESSSATLTEPETLHVDDSEVICPSMWEMIQTNTPQPMLELMKDQAAALRAKLPTSWRWSWSLSLNKRCLAWYMTSPKKL